MSIWEVKAEKIERLRERKVRIAIWAIDAVIIAAAAWAVWALVTVKRESARLAAETAQAHYERVCLEGWGK